MANYRLGTPTILSGSTTLTNSVINGATSSSGNFNFSGSTGTFITSTGAVTLSGNTTVASSKTFSIADMTSGSVLFAGTAGLLAQDNTSFIWDNTNKNLSVTSTGSGPLRLKSSSTSAYNEVFFYDTASSVRGVVGYGNSAVAETARQNRFYLWSQTGVNIAFVGASNSEFGIIDTTNSRWGIGTMTPTHKLHVQNSSSVESQIKARTTSASGVAAIEFYNSADAHRLSVGYANTGGNNYIYGASGIDFSIDMNAGTQRHMFKSGGTVGLGVTTVNSSNRLEVSGAMTVGTYTNTAAPSNGMIVSGLVGLGLNNPSTYQLSVVQSLNSDVPITIRNSSTSGYSGQRYENNSGVFQGAEGYGNASASITHLQNKLFLLSNGSDFVFANNTANELLFGLINGSAMIEFNSGNSAAVSNSNRGRIRYNSTGQLFQISENGGSYDGITLLTKSQTLSSKTLTTPVINGATSTSGNFDLSGSSGTFKTTTGAVTIGSGAITVTGIMTFNAFINPNYGGTSTNVQTPTWTAVSYENSYVDVGSGYPNTAYYKDALGQVHVRISATGGSPTSTIFTLPVGFRPSGNKVFLGLIDGTYKHILVNSDGTVLASGGTSNVLLGEIIFTAES